MGTKLMETLTNQQSNKTGTKQHCRPAALKPAASSVQPVR